MIVPESTDMVQNPIAQAKYTRFVGQTDAFFIQYYLDNAIVTHRSCIEANSRNGFSVIDPGVLDDIRHSYYSNLKHSELGRFNINLDVSHDVIQQRVRLLSKLGWRPQGFFELLDKHFPTA